jgi:1-acyl-sn-glycerol-3-phosphate acyltransferase
VPEFEPWFTLVHASIRPPVAAWFNWRLEGMEHIPREGPALVAANHISYFDPIAHGYMMVKAGRTPRFLAKRELFDNPFLRVVLSGAKQIPVDRGSGSVAPLAAAVDAIRHGEVVVVYPEATITKDPDCLPMRGKTGIARLALETGVPVLPLAIWGAQHIWQKTGAGDLRFGRPIWLKAGPPLDLSEFEPSKDELPTLRTVTDTIMDELRRLVLELRAGYPKKWSA